MMNLAAKLLRSVVSCHPFDTLRMTLNLLKGQLSVVLVFFFSISLFTLTLTLVAPTPVSAGECDPSAPPTDAEAIDRINKCAIERNVFDDKVFNLNQIAGTTDSLYNLITGKSKLHPETDDITADAGALTASGRLVASLYSVPPVSGVQYFAQKIRDVNPVKPAYAQAGTIGFDALRPVQQIWTVFRNISYIGFVLVFVIMGFMIMFRAHISPQAVATVQDSIPRIVIALVLVTFSYALAGLMIDIMFLVLNVIINALEATNLLADSGYVFKDNVFTVIFSAWGDSFKHVFSAVSRLVDGTVNTPIEHLDKLLGFFGGSLAALVVGIALLFIMFRVFLMLLMAYAMIIVLTMAAPFFFLVQALPGRNGAGEWFKQMASQVAIFPTVALMFVFAGILGGIESLGGSGTSAIGEQQVGQFPLFVGGIDSNVVGGLIGIGILLMTPSAAELVKNAIGAKGPQLGGGIGSSLGAGAGVVQGAARWGTSGSFNPIADRLKERDIRRQERVRQSVATTTGGDTDRTG